MRQEFYTFVLLITTTTRLLSQNCDSTGFDKFLVKNIINKQFGNLINPQSNNNIGNFASLDLKEAEVNLTGNFAFKSGTILGLKVTGGVTDGILPIFTNSTLNSKLGIGLQFNFLSGRKKSISYDNSSCLKYKNQKKELDHKYELREIEITLDYTKTLLSLEIKNLEKQLAQLKIKMNTEEGFSKDSLKVEILKSGEEISYKNDQLNSLPTKGKQLFDLNNLRATEMEKIQTEVELYGFTFGWFSIGVGITNNSFKLFYPNVDYDKQITNSAFLSSNLRVQYSLYHKSPRDYRSYYISVGTAFSIDDNLSTLAKVEINETKSFGLTANDRFVTTKYDAYQGSYLNNLKTISFYADFYLFLFAHNKGALHIYPEQKITKNLNPVTNTGFGFVIILKNKEKVENIINSEVYVNLLDLFNNNNPSKNLLNRSTYGLRFSVPVNFN